MSESPVAGDPAGERWTPDDPYDYPGWPLEQRIVAIVADIDVKQVDTSGGDYEEVVGLIANARWRELVLMADTMGLVGDWGVDDVEEAVINALHEYRKLKEQAITRSSCRPLPSVPEEPGVAGVMRPVVSTANTAVVPLFATAAQRPRDPMDFTYRTLGEVFAALLYCANNGEDIRRRLERFAELTANDPVPRSIADDDNWQDDDD